MTRLASWTALAAAAVLAGCAAVPPPAATPRAPAFDLIGRVSVSSAGRVFSSHLRWAHGSSRDEIWLMTPMGQALARITGDAGGATLSGSDGSELEADDIESLMRRALGWELPVARLAWWVQGGIVPAGVIGEVVRDGEGRLVRLRQDGWRIELAHPPAGGRDPRPGRVALAEDQLRIRIVIDRWREAPDQP